MSKTDKRVLYALSASLPVFVMLIVFLFNNIYPFGQNTVMAIDFNQQYIDLFAFFKRSVLSLDFGSLFYSFSKSLGGEMLGIWGYYLLSPFNLVYVIFPVEEFRLATTVIILLRYSAMGLTFCHFVMKRYPVKSYNQLLVPLFSVAYALCAFNINYQMNPIWYDAMVMLPLVMIGVETVLDGKAGYKYSLVLGLSIVFQYYMSYMMCLFIVLYGVFYAVAHANQAHWYQQVKYILTRLLRLALYSLLAVGLSMVILLPVVKSLLASKGTYNQAIPFLFSFSFDPVDILSKFMIGAFDSDQMPNGFPNVYVGAVALLGFGSFFFMRQFNKKERIMGVIVSLIFTLSMVHDFSNKIWHLGQTPAWFFHRFTYLSSFLMIVLAYRALNGMKKVRLYQLLFMIAFSCLLCGIVLQRNYTFIQQPQVWMTVVVLVCVAILLALHQKSTIIWLVALCITLFELGANAYISQSRIGYANAYTFQNAQSVLQSAIDPIRPQDNTFYRIEKLFVRSKNDPFMVDYPGVTHFSSTFEKTTLNLLGYMGNSDSSAATVYNSGTPLTDALFSIRYLVQLRNLKENQLNDNTIYYFTRNTTRKDLYTYYHTVFETDRVRVYENNNVLPLAFGVSSDIVTATMVSNDPVQNQEKLLQVFEAKDTPYFMPYAFEKVELSNLTADNPDDLQNASFVRTDKSKEGVVTYVFTPQTNDSYYISLADNADDEKFSMTLNTQNYEYYRPFDHRQLWNIAKDVKDQQTSFSVRTSELDRFSLYGTQLLRLDNAAVDAAIAKRAKQGMQVTKMSDTFIEGQVTITDDSKFLLTSIPYNVGWHVRVDGKEVEVTKVLDSLMAIPIEAGEHKIEMTFVQDGVLLGATITVISLGIIVGLYMMNRRKKDATI